MDRNRLDERRNGQEVVLVRGKGDVDGVVKRGRLSCNIFMIAISRSCCVSLVSLGFSEPFFKIDSVE